MERADLARWLADYVAVWKSYDPEAIAALFSEDVSYSYRPHGDTITGRDAVVKSWIEDDPDAPGSFDAAYEPYAVDGDRAVAVGSSTYTHPDGSIRKIYDNVFLLRFDDEGSCREFVEYFIERQV